MAHISRYHSGGWQARYRDAAGRQHAKHFRRKVDAQDWLNAVSSSMVTGTYTDPRTSRITLKDWSATWFAGQLHLKATGRTRVEGIVRLYIVPRWGSTSLRDVSHAEVQAWVTQLQAGGLSASSVQRAHGILSQMLDLAVRDRRLTINPAKGVKLPRKLPKARRFLTAAQVSRPWRSNASRTAWWFGSWHTRVCGGVRWPLCGSATSILCGGGCSSPGR